MTAQDDIINDIAGDERLWKSKKGCEDDEAGAQQPFSPVAFDKGLQVFERD